MITVKGLVDREKGDFYTLTVVADDGGPKVDSTVVSVTSGSGSLPTTSHGLDSVGADVHGPGRGVTSKMGLLGA